MNSGLTLAGVPSMSALPTVPHSSMGFAVFVGWAGVGPVDVAGIDCNVVGSAGGDEFFGFGDEDAGFGFDFFFNRAFAFARFDEVVFDVFAVQFGPADRAARRICPVDVFGVDGDPDGTLGDEFAAFDRAARGTCRADRRGRLFGAGVGVIGEHLRRGEECRGAVGACRPGRRPAGSPRNPEGCASRPTPESCKRPGVCYICPLPASSGAWLG